MEYKVGVWYGWNGGECPVHPRSKVEYVWRFIGGQNIIFVYAGDAPFKGNKHGDIIAFRIIKEHREPREFWMIRDSAYKTKAAAETALKRLSLENPDLDFGEVFYVREVLPE